MSTNMTKIRAMMPAAKLKAEAPRRAFLDRRSLLDAKLLTNPAAEDTRNIAPAKVRVWSTDDHPPAAFDIIA